MKPYEKICSEDPREMELVECHKYPKCEGCPRAEELEQLKSIGLVEGEPLPLHWKV